MKAAVLLTILFLLASGVILGNDGAALFVALKCTKCHEVSTIGIKTVSDKDPEKITDLAEVGSRREEAWLFAYLRKEIEKDGKKHKMKFKGDDEQMKLMVAWLLTLETK